MIELNELIDHFTTRYTHTPSSLGNQLLGLEVEAERVAQQAGDPLAVIEINLHRGEVFRAVQLLIEKGPPVEGKLGRVYPAISRVRDNFRLAGQQWSMGEVISSVMHSYQEFGTRSPARGLSSVYRLLNTVNPLVYPLPNEELEKAAKATAISAALYADVLLSLDSFVKGFNAKQRVGRA